ncbi:MAG: CPBP family intramembrane metalloprotease [Spirochaetes bacterium]|nr:CPBP family intramembrane metalloprotease [Spirochaetota bacterium]
MKNIIRHNPVLAYFILTFILSWSGVGIFAIFTGMPAPIKQFEQTWPIAFIPYLFGPAIISLLLTGVLYGKPGLIEIKSRYLRWSINIGWYAFAILMLPLLVSIILFIFSYFSPEYIPDIITADNKIGLIIQGIAIGLIGGGILEETGWTGFVTPELRKRFGILKTGLIIGFFWGLWHLFPVFWGCGDESGNISWGLFLPGFFFYFSGTLAYRVLLVWVHEHTKSLLPVALMHMSLTASLFFIFNIPQNGFPAFIYYLVLSIALWIIVGISSLTKSWKEANHIKD